MALKLGPALLVIVSFAALLLGLILHGISINEVQYRNPPAKHFKNDVVIGDKLDNNLVWFLQVTDLHISHRDIRREADFVEFSKTYLDYIEPDVVLVTGDITDGRKPNTTFGTGPQLDEWLAYSNAITKTNAINKTRWLDIRGNHDNFNVYRPQDPNTLYRQYSIMGKKHSRNYHDILEKTGQGDNVKRYSFIGVDEVQTPGLKIPFNFIGLVKEEDLNELRRFKDIARDKNSEYTIWFAHYPTSSIASPNEGLRNIIDGPYLCGHYHTIGNWVVQMHATQQPGFAEVELGDWKYNRRLRLASIDHQLFNFVDVQFKQFPIALMTNPKKPEYSMPKFEPVDRIKQSTHIRVLAFTNATSIRKVEISIDDGERRLLRNSKGPLWVLDWNPKDYATGLHQAEIIVEDSNGVRLSYNQDFSLDQSKKDFSLGAKILLRAYFKTIVMSIFYFVVSICTLPLLILSLVSYRNYDVGLKRHYKGTFLFILHLLCNIKRLFIPLFTIPIWMAVGPHFMGYMVDEALGACFVWGIIIDGGFIHTGITFNVGSIFLLFVHIPEVILLTYQVSSSHKSLAQNGAPTSVLRVRMILHVAVTMIQLWMGALLYSAYGGISFLTSFPYVWCIIIYAYCWFQCANLEKADFAGLVRPASTTEQQPLTSQRARDDKSSASDQSTC